MQREYVRDFDKIGFDLSSAFNDVQLIPLTSSDVGVPLSHLTISKINILQQLQMI